MTYKLQLITVEGRDNPGPMATFATYDLARAEGDNILRQGGAFNAYEIWKRSATFRAVVEIREDEDQSV